MMTTQQKCPERIMVLANAAIPKACQLSDEVSQSLLSLSACVEKNQMNFDADGDTLDLSGFDLLIALGGDGTMLRAGHLCATQDIPLLGINAGRFGFLAELGAENWRDSLPRLISGEYRLEKRMMLRVNFKQSGSLAGNWDVINELVVCRGQYVRPIEVKVEINEGYLTSYIADGLITATATGSTAYALAVGGPILPPELRNVLLIPIAPHLSLDRAVILAEGASVCIHVQTSHEAVFSVDGHDSIPMHNGDLLQVTANQKSLKMVRFQDPAYFYKNLTSYMENNPVIKTKNDA
jgi:NAD+ kinase